MEPLFIEGTEDTPQINFDSNTLELMISGRSLPEDVKKFYEPVLSWLENLDTTADKNISFQFKLEYFNTASSKIILDILMRIEEYVNEEKARLLVKWYYSENDQDMLEAGEEYKDIVNVPFEIASYS